MRKIILCLLCMSLMLANAEIAIAQFGNALVLDGCTNFLEINDNDLLDYDQNLSIECWIRPNCEDGNNIILSKQWCQGQFGYYLSVNNGKLFWSYSFSGDCSSPNSIQTINTEIPVDQFTHVAVVHSTSEVKLFINGIEVTTEQSTGVFGDIINSSEPLRIGVYKNIDGSISNHFSGLIDEVRLWNIELNETLIQQRKDTPLQGNEVGLILYQNMEQIGQGASLILENQSSYGATFDAFVVGFTSYSPYTLNHQNYDDNIINLGNDITICVFPISLSIENGNYKSILWSNDSTNSEISALNPGEYSVIVETELCKFYVESIRIEQPNNILISNEYSLCENDTITINNIAYFQEGIYLDTITSSGAGCDTIFENSIVTNLASSIYIELETCPNTAVNYEGEFLEPGSITTFSFTDNHGCDSIVTIEVIPSLVLNEEINISACDGIDIEYNNSILLPDTSTEFTFTSFEGCDSIVTVNVDLIPSNNSFLGNDVIVCSTLHTLNSPNGTTLWSNGIQSGSIDITTSGFYYAEFIDSLGCTNSDTIHVQFLEHDIYVPNVFSPNNDGNNDCFKPLFSTNFVLDSYRFSIYSRWGEKLFETTDINECWEGNFRGISLNPGVFSYLIEGYNIQCDNPELLSGSITLLK